MIKFMGAKVTFDDEGEKQYAERGEIFIREAAIIGYYDHTILMDRHTIYVMETLDQIRELLGGYSGC